MRPKILKYILLGFSILGILIIGMISAYQANYVISFLNEASAEEPSWQERPIHMTSYDNENDVRISKYLSHQYFNTVQLHKEKIHYQSEVKDTLQQYKYITIENMQNAQTVDEQWVVNNDSIIFNVQPVDYQNLQTKASIPFEKDKYQFWFIYLLSRILVNALIFGSILILTFLIAKNAFTNSPFTETIRNKLYMIGALIILYVGIDFLYSWIILRRFIQNNYGLSTSSHYTILGPWLFMGLLILFIATIFDYGIRLQKEQDLTI